MNDLLQDLNAEQREAVTATEGYVRVVAGAGSGKTRALARRFAYLVGELGILPGNILCVTFTNKSAAEMRRRIHALTGDNDTGYICTFHSFCVSVLQEDSHAVQYPKSFLVLDNADIDAMLGILYEERGLTLREMTFAKARDMIEIRKTIQEPAYYLDMVQMPLDALRQKYLAAEKPADIIFYGYLYQQKKCFGLDYNDLIKFTLYIFEQDAAIRLKWQKRLEYIMIDEFQDIDPLQYALMNALCGYHNNLFVVGDPDQTIYSWRGANIRYLLDFDHAFPGTKTILMNRNYRSTPQILAAVNSLIDKNKNRIKKELTPTLPPGAPVRCHHADTAADEADWIAQQIEALRDAGTPLREIAVLYRAHYVTRTVEEAFLRKKIPYAVYSGVQFFGRMEIRDAVAYLRMITYKDDLSFLRIANLPKRNLGRRRMAFLKEYAQAHGCTLYEALGLCAETELFAGTGAAGFLALIERFSGSAGGRPVSEVAAALLDESGYERMLRTEGSQERLDNLAEFKQSIYEYETTCGEECTLEQYLAHVALFSGGEGAEDRERVRLMTVHTAKGLEFPYVFLCGLNEGIFPSRKINTMPGMEEERRLAFVAMTRAQKALFLSEGAGRNFDGSSRYPSRFLLDIDPALLEFSPCRCEELYAQTRDAVQASERFLADSAARGSVQPGARVRHSVFGMGTVVEVDLARSANLIHFDDMDTPRAISFRAKLEICPE